MGFLGMNTNGRRALDPLPLSMGSELHGDSSKISGPRDTGQLHQSLSLAHLNPSSLVGLNAISDG